MMEPDSGPVPRTWYRDVLSDRIFCVTDVDAANDVVEIQHFDGDIEQIDSGEWGSLDLELADPPRDWSGPLDRTEPQDLDDGESEARRRRSSAVLTPTGPATRGA